MTNTLLNRAPAPPPAPPAAIAAPLPSACSRPAHDAVLQAVACLESADAHLSGSTPADTDAALGEMGTALALLYEALAASRQGGG
jgi:hypothetical protein